MNSQIEEIKQKLDIISVVQSYVPSLKASGRNYFGLCPFHSEKSPSFSVNPELSIYKCFGCGEGGDVITFIQKVEGLDFRQALQLAAEKAGVKLEETSSPAAEKRRQLEQRALEAHKLAADYYHYILLQHSSGKPGLEYATKKRKLTIEIIKEYKLGYCPNSYHNLENFLIKKGFSKDELVQFGLLVNKDGKIFDKFRGRLLHPIMNMQGKVVGFSGRIIDPNSKAPKYLNSPETVIYHKSELAYGAFQAKEAMRKTHKVILVEGNIDVVSSAKVGVKYIVCPLGTSLTPAQLKLLKRYVTEILFCYDTDAAGKKALLRSLELTEQAGLTAKAVSVGKYKDADEMITADSGLWMDQVENAQEIPQFIIQAFKDDFDLGTATGKIDYLKTTLPYIAKLQNEVKIDHYLQELEKITGTKYEIMMADVNKLRREMSLLSKEQSSRKFVPESLQSQQPQESRQSQAGKLQSGELGAATRTSSEGAEGEAELQEEPKATIKVNRSLQNILALCYALKNDLPKKDVLAEIYRGNLSQFETNLFDAALGIIPESKLSADEREQLGMVLASSKSLPAITDDPQPEMVKSIRAYVRERLKFYLRSLQQQQKLSSELEAGAADKITNRINLYIQKLASLR